MYKFFVEKLEK